VANLCFWETDIPIDYEELATGLVMEVPAQISCGRRGKSDYPAALGLYKFCLG
jgi:hypothetical protein